MLTHHKLDFLAHFPSIQYIALLVLPLYPASGWLYVEFVVVVLLNYPIIPQ